MCLSVPGANPFASSDGRTNPTTGLNQLLLFGEFAMRTCSLLSVLLLVACQPADDSDVASPDSYLGQEPPGTTAQLFFPGMVSTEAGELNSVFSPDFQEFYFTRRGIPNTPPQIMVSRRGPQGWGSPESAGFDQHFSAIDLFLTQDGHGMVFCSNRPRHGGDSPQVDHDLWMSVREGTGWGEPQAFAPQAMSDSEDFYPIITESGNLYFNSQRDGPGTNNIFRSTWMEGRYQAAEKLPPPINSEFREFDAFVSPGEDMIIFSSDRPGGIGRADIYISHLENGRWSEPMNLGTAVNSEASEYGPMLSPDGRFLFFTSSRAGSEDIYWVSAEILGLPKG